ncbi:MAM33 domain-containing protein [Cephalotus follicularis]|uniref:MAM33 domain-containing protein n=1 Tax=Cephalotus follicularis TaxID=3775 RepID=A0A1Q3BRX5_CEPFO|nr:MAM33 domain-containing protein [Cephalotus follicularis]
MARLIRTAQIRILSSSPLIHRLSPQSHHCCPSTSTPLFHCRPYSTHEFTKSPFQNYIIRILRNEIEYQSEHAPPHQPETKFNSFIVQDRPREQWMTMSGISGDNEDIKIEVTMFDGFVMVPRVGEDASGHDVRLHISVLVDIYKGDDGSNALEFVCSAWLDSLEIQKVYILSQDKKQARLYMGPNFSPMLQSFVFVDIRSMDGKLRKTLREFLEARGVNNELSRFLHVYMRNKDRIELVRWLGSVKSFVEK